MDNNIKTLHYTIHSYSSFSSSYLPENIRDNSPQNQISRWSSETNTPTQFIMLKLSKPSIVKYIKFGKYEKPHVCNLKKFRVMGGMDTNNLCQMFEGGLKNDSTPEVFELRHKTFEHEDFPVLYIQVIPLLSYGPSFNFSIWYVELLGLEDDLIVCSTLQNYNEQKEKTTIRLILKHLRNKGYFEAFKALSHETNIQLEDPEITELYQCLVDVGDFARVEQIMEKLINDGNIEEFISKQKYKAKLTELKSVNRPKPRSQAAYAFDDDRKLMYMFGGTDDANELNDFWVYDTTKNEWMVIECSNGPSPRSGCKMVFDPMGNQLFILGRKSSRGSDNLKSDFYLFDVSRRSWILICEDTSLENGPATVCEHQMCISLEHRTIYIFGGKLTNKPDDSNNDTYSDFYAYHINTNTWNKLFVDSAHSLASNPDVQSVKSRINHSLLYDDKTRKIYIFGGQRGKEICLDFLKYDIDANTITSVPITEPDTSSQSIFAGPSLATIDVNRGEVFALLRDCLWVFSLATSEWSLIYKSTMHTFTSPESFVFDSVAKKHFVVNSGSEFFLELSKPSRIHIFSYCKYLIRKQNYEEITHTNSIDALMYLRNDLAETIDRNDNEQVNDFHKLASLLFCNKTGDSKRESDEDLIKTRNQRSKLFNKLIELLPESKCQPRPNLCNFINI